MKNGEGIYKFASGAEYKGTFKNNKYHGKGVYKHASGAVFEGTYLEGERSGPGVLKSAASDVLFDGEWRNGKKVVEGKVSS